jgi:hypothetical protein
MKPSLFYQPPSASNTRRAKGSADSRTPNESFRNTKHSKDRGSNQNFHQEDLENFSNNDFDNQSYLPASQYSSGNYQRVSSPTKSSKQVLKRVFDEDFAIHSSNKKKRPDEGVSTLLANSIANRLAASNNLDPENQMAMIANNLANLRIEEHRMGEGSYNRSD